MNRDILTTHNHHKVNYQVDRWQVFMLFGLLLPYLELIVALGLFWNQGISSVDVNILAFLAALMIGLYCRLLLLVCLL